MKLRFPVKRDTLRKDAVAGLVLGVESVPDGLAASLLAGVNPGPASQRAAGTDAQ